MKSTNKFSTSLSKEKTELSISRKNPFQRIAVMLNAYHAISDMYGTKEEKEKNKELLKSEILSNLKYVSEDIHSEIKASLKNKTVWEDLRKRIL